MNKPTKINILGKTYKIIYCKTPGEIDLNKKDNSQGLINFWEKTIRIYNDPNQNDLLDTLLHEILHGIIEELNLTKFADDKAHDQLEALSTVLADTLVRNNIIKL